MNALAPHPRPAVTTRVARAARLGRFVSQTLVTWARASRRRVAPGTRAELAVDCARRTLAVLHVDVTIRGEALLERGPVLVVANHVSWLDVHVLNALGCVGCALIGFAFRPDVTVPDTEHLVAFALGVVIGAWLLPARGALDFSADDVDRELDELLLTRVSR